MLSIGVGGKWKDYSLTHIQKFNWIWWHRRKPRQCSLGPLASVGKEKAMRTPNRPWLDTVIWCDNLLITKHNCIYRTLRHSVPLLHRLEPTVGLANLLPRMKEKVREARSTMGFRRCHYWSNYNIATSWAVHVSYYKLVDHIYM